MTAAPSLPTKKTFISFLTKGYGLPIVCILGSLILLLVAVRPTLAKIQELRARQAEARDILLVLTDKIEQLESFAARGEALDLDFEGFNRAIPSESNIPTLLTQVQSIAKRAGVKISALQFGGQARTGAGGEGRTIGEQRWLEVRLKFAAQSPENNFQKLLRIFENATRIIDVETIRYSAQVDKETKALTLTSELALVAYYTPKPELSPETPITFSFDDPTFDRNSQVLEQLTPYTTEMP